MKTKDNLKLFKFVEELQTIEIPSPPFYMKRQLSKDDFDEMASNTTYSVLSDPVTDLPNKRKHVFCECRICGYRRHVKLSSLKEKSVICDQCFKTKLEKEAINAGLTLVGEAHELHSRTYKFNTCGHTREARTEYVREGRVFCRECLFDRVVEACKAANYTPLVTKELCSYKFKASCDKCGLIANKNLRGIGRCSQCIIDRVKESAENVGAEYIRYSHPSHALFKLKCGHENVLPVKKFEEGRYDCKPCLHAKYEQAAKFSNVEIDLGNQDLVSRKYMCKLPCGCSQYVRMDTLEKGRVYCEHCLDRSQTRETSLYLFRIESKGYTFLKLGISIAPDERLTQYKLDPNSIVTLVMTITENTWLAAVKKEKAIHKKLKELRIDPSLMKNYMVSGFTECYPENCEQRLKNELHKIKAQYDS